jgi:HEAT repeats
MLDPRMVCVGWLVENIFKELEKTALECYMNNLFEAAIKDVVKTAKSACPQNDVGEAIRSFANELEQEWERVSADNVALRTTAIQELARRWQDDPETLSWLKRIAESPNYVAVRIAAVEEVARGWKSDSKTLYWLKQCAQSSNDRSVRIAAVEELASGWKDDPGLLELLGDRAWGDRDPEFREFAQRKLTELKGDRQ